MGEIIGNLKEPHAEATKCLCDLINSERRSNENEHISLRAIAFRNLKRLDSKTAMTFIDSPAFEEYAQAIDYWIVLDIPKNQSNREELQNELAWLTELKKK